MTSKERSMLMSSAQALEPVVRISKSSVTPEITDAVSEYIEVHELIKIDVLKNCFDDIRELAQTVADRTHSQVVQIIGRKIVLYKMAKDPKNRKFNI